MIIIAVVAVEGVFIAFKENGSYSSVMVNK